jgi:hypothetical protein
MQKRPAGKLPPALQGDGVRRDSISGRVEFRIKMTVVLAPLLKLKPDERRNPQYRQTSPL